MGVMREQKKKKRKEKGERARGKERAPAQDSWCWAAFDVFAGSKLNVQLTEGKALFHGGNMKVDVQSEFSGGKN